MIHCWFIAGSLLIHWWLTRQEFLFCYFERGPQTYRAFVYLEETKELGRGYRVHLYSPHRNRFSTHPNLTILNHCKCPWQSENLRLVNSSTGLFVIAQDTNEAHDGIMADMGIIVPGWPGMLMTFAQVTYHLWQDVYEYDGICIKLSVYVSLCIMCTYIIHIYI